MPVPVAQCVVGVRPRAAWATVATSPLAPPPALRQALAAPGSDEVDRRPLRRLRRGDSEGAGGGRGRGNRAATSKGGSSSDEDDDGADDGDDDDDGSDDDDSDNSGGGDYTDGGDADAASAPRRLFGRSTAAIDKRAAAAAAEADGGADGSSPSPGRDHGGEDDQDRDVAELRALLRVGAPEAARFAGVLRRAERTRADLAAHLAAAGGRGGGQMRGGGGGGGAPGGGATVISPAELTAAVGVTVQSAEALLGASSSAAAATNSDGSAAARPALKLAPHQYIGVNWMHLLYTAGINGVLADAMGLGKTVQVATLLAYLAAVYGNTGPHLVVAPLSTISNWKRELGVWAPTLRVGVYRGGAGKVEEQRRLLRPGGNPDAVDDTADGGDGGGGGGGSDSDVVACDDSADDADDGSGSDSEYALSDVEVTAAVRRPRGRPPRGGWGSTVMSPVKDAAARGFDVLMVAYSLFDRRDASAKADRAFLRSLAPFEYVILDEGHAVKNTEAERHRHLSALAGTAHHRLLLSGTPFQNELGELAALLRFVAGTAVFNARAQEALAALEGAVLGDAGTSGPRRRRIVGLLRRLVDPFILRRTKAEVLASLPPKTDVWHRLDLPPRQAALYATLVSRMRRVLSGGSPGAAEAAQLAAGRVASDGVAVASPVVVADDPASPGAGAGEAGTTAAAAAAGVAAEVAAAAAAAGITVVQRASRSRTRAGAPAPAPLTAMDGQTPMAASRVSVKLSSNLFATLRKATQHPLLLRTSWYSDATLRHKLAAALRSAGMFRRPEGGMVEMPAVLECMEGMSDFEVHNMVCSALAGVKGQALSECTFVADATDTGGGGGGTPGSGGGEDDVLHLPSGANSQAAVLAAGRLPLRALMGAAKMVYLASVLPGLAADGHRVLLFSQWTTILDIVEHLLRHLHLPYTRLDGTTPVPERQVLIDAFSAPTSPLRVFLLSTRAGGLGINLTAADTVLLYDSDLNPHVDAQAVDRAHRIGQTRPVTVTRLLASATVDDVIHRIAARKSDLAEAFAASLAAVEPAGGAAARGGSGEGAATAADGDGDGDDGAPAPTVRIADLLSSALAAWA